MRTINIIELSTNDGWQVASNKINENFRNLYRALQSNGDTELQNTRVNLETKIAEAEERLNQIFKEAVEELNQTINDAETRLDTKIETAEKELDKKIVEVNKLIKELDDRIESEQSTQDATVTGLRNNIKNLIYGASIKNNQIIVPSGFKIPTANINVYSPDASLAIVSHTGTKTGDARVR